MGIHGYSLAKQDLFQGSGRAFIPLALACPLGNFVLTVNQSKYFEIFNSWLVGCVWLSYFDSNLIIMLLYNILSEMPSD